MSRPSRESVPAGAPVPAHAAAPSTVPSFDALRVAVQPGDAVVARFSGLVLVASAEGAGVERLLEVCREVSVTRSRAPGRTVARRLAGWLAAADADESGDFGVLTATDDGLAVFLCGRATLFVPDEDPLSGAHAAAWVDRLIPWPSGHFALTLGVDPGPPPSSQIALLDLRLGVVPGTGLVLTPQAAAAAPAVPPAPGPSAPPVPAPPVPPHEPSHEFLPVQPPPAPEPAPEPVLEPSARAEPILGVRSDEPARPPLPTNTSGASQLVTTAQPVPHGVLAHGYLCSRKHLNDPRAQFCAICGIRMAELTAAFVQGVRPPLGLLVFDDGASFTLDGDYLLGRKPDIDDRVRQGTVRPLVIQDTQGLVSRAHLNIQLQGWDVFIDDTGSANGTYVMGQGALEWSALVPGRPLRLAPGSRVSIGNRSFVFESSLAR